MWEFIIAGFTLLGSVYLWYLGRHAALHDRQREMFANALATVLKWQEMPYRILRRDPSGSRQSLHEQMHDLQEELGFYRAWIAIESKEIGAAYEEFIVATKEQATPFLQEAWTSDPPVSPNVGNRFRFDTRDQERKYLREVRKHFQPWPSRIFRSEE